MLVIRDEQLQLLANDVRVRSIQKFLLSNFPKESKKAAHDLTGLVERSANRAEQHGLTVYRDCLRYVILSLILGEHFERNPAYPWASTILSDRHSALAGKRAARLYQTAVRQLKQEESRRKHE